MKAIRTMTVALLGLAGIALCAAAAPLEFWTMDDPFGTDLNNLTNSGSLGSVWNYNTPGVLADGSGNLVVDGDGGTTTRKLPKAGTANANPGSDTYATPLSGAATYRLELNLTSWAFDPASVGDALRFKIRDSSQADLVVISILMDSSSSSRIRLAAGDKGRNWAFGSSAGATTAYVDFNIAAGTVEMNVAGDVRSYTGVAFSGSDIGDMVFTKSGDGTADWATSGTSIAIDSMGLSVVPEPGTAGLLLVSGGVLFMARKKRTRRWKG